MVRFTQSNSLHLRVLSPHPHSDRLQGQTAHWWLWGHGWLCWQMFIFFYIFINIKAVQKFSLSISHIIMEADWLVVVRVATRVATSCVSAELRYNSHCPCHTTLWWESDHNTNKTKLTVQRGNKKTLCPADILIVRWVMCSYKFLANAQSLRKRRTGPARLYYCWDYWAT